LISVIYKSLCAEYLAGPKKGGNYLHRSRLDEILTENADEHGTAPQKTSSCQRARAGSIATLGAA